MKIGKGKNWRLLHHIDIPDIHKPGTTYLTRWKLISTPWFGIYLHHIRRPDWTRSLHDHPWSFFSSLVLKGGYCERLLRDGVERRNYWGRWSIHTMHHGDFHAITTLEPETWTLLFVGRRLTDWGFLTANGWVDHHTYIRSIKEANAA